MMMMHSVSCNNKDDDNDHHLSHVVGSNDVYFDQIFDNNTLIVQLVAQLGAASLPGSQHNLLVTVDYGMDGVDYINNVTVNVTDPEQTVFNAVSFRIELKHVTG